MKPRISAEQNLLDTIEFNYHQQGNFKEQFWKMMIEPVKAEAIKELEQKLAIAKEALEEIDKPSVVWVNTAKKIASDALAKLSE